MFTSTVKYLGNLRTEATHERSGNSVITDAPKDNHGKGEYFSPTDSAATALATCMITVVGIKANQKGFELGNVLAEVTKTMASNPRRISKIQVDLHFENDFEEEVGELIRETAMNCPVALSLHPDIEQEVNFSFGSAKNFR